MEEEIEINIYDYVKFKFNDDILESYIYEINLDQYQVYNKITEKKEYIKKENIINTKNYIKDMDDLNVQYLSEDEKVVFDMVIARINMEYEKTFYPFCILAKKKYVGNKYENNPNKFKQACMGIVLKRRDNPPIVKKIIGGMLDIMLNIMDNEQVVQYVRNSIENLLDGKFSIRNFITSKALRDGYKYKDGDIDQNGKDITKTISIIDTFNNIHTDEAKKKISYVKQAHVQLAARMAIRDPGNKPQLNDRIPYVAIEVQSEKKLLQGDVIEHPEYIIKNNLKVDYLFYLTNQIMNPSIQFLELIVDEPNKIFKDYCDKIKKNKELAFNEKKQNEYVSNMINNFGFKVNTNNEDWDINIDGLIKQVKNNNPNTEKPKTRKKKK
jgi:DNA polymerase elongation subunit (family B)